MNTNNPFLLEVDFHIEDLMTPTVTQNIVDEFINFKEVDSDPDGYADMGHNVTFRDNEFNNEIARRFVMCVDEHFIIDRDSVVVHSGQIGTTFLQTFRPINSWIYCQNKDNHASVWHNHIHSSSINAVCYWNLPNVGGELELDIFQTKIKIKPKKNKLYMFPYWVNHRPLPQDDEDWRISINIEFLTERRPIRKNGRLW